jgi:hypothetical protein
MKTVTDFGVLMRLASRLGKAKQSGTKEDIEKAQQEHDAYKKLCLESDEMSTGVTSQELYSGRDHSRRRCYGAN